MASGFRINKQGIAKMAREIEKEFAKHPVRLPIEADPSGIGLPAAVTVNNYHGPVVTVTGDHAQLAWGNRDVNQGQERVEQIAPGYEALATVITDLLANLAEFDLGDDEADVRANAEEVLAEVVRPEPNPGVIKRAVTMLKGLLAPVAAGVAAAAKAETVEQAASVIDALGSALPF